MKLQEAEKLINEKNIQLSIIGSAKQSIESCNFTINKIEEWANDSPVSEELNKIEKRINELAIKEWEALIVLSNYKIKDIEVKFK